MGMPARTWSWPCKVCWLCRKSLAPPPPPLQTSAGLRLSGQRLCEWQRELTCRQRLLPHRQHPTAGGAALQGRRRRWRHAVAGHCARRPQAGTPRRTRPLLQLPRLWQQVLSPRPDLLGASLQMAAPTFLLSWRPSAPGMQSRWARQDSCRRPSLCCLRCTVAGPAACPSAGCSRCDTP